MILIRYPKLFNIFFLFSLQYFYVYSLSHGELAVRSALSGEPSEEQCRVLQQTVDDISNAFSCVQPNDCNIECPTTDIPVPPEYNPSGEPPLPTGEVIVPTTTTTTCRGTTTTKKPSTPSGNNKPSPTNTDIQSGTYIASWYAYKKFYMGVQNLNVFDKKVSPETSSSEYVFFPYHLRKFASKLTHIYYSFWKITQQCHVELDDPDAAWWGAVSNVEPVWIPVPHGACKGIMNDMMALKSEFPHLKMLVSLGGWTFSKYFSKCASTSSTRQTVIKTIFYRLREMDSNFGKQNAVWNGVDLDWEFPEAANGLYPDHTDNDWDNFVKLTTEFKEAAKQEQRNDFMVTSAIGTGETLTRLTSKPDVTKRFCNAMDMVNVMTYDLHGKWDKTTGHNANFCKDPRTGDRSLGLSVLDVITKLLNAGCPSRKLSLGIPNYSPAWTHIPPGVHRNGLFTTASSDQFVGWSTFSDKDDSLIPQGIISYWDMKNVVNDDDFEIFSYDCPVNHGVVVPIKHVYSASRQAFSCYEDLETVRAKVTWAKAMDLGGFFFWDSQQDKNGELLSAAFSTWGGLKEHPASGTYSCRNDKKPDFTKDPSTGKNIEVVCQLTGNYLDLRQGDSCSALKKKAESNCGSKTPIVNGGSREWARERCLNMCSPTWGGTGNMAMVGDRVYYTCT